MFGYTNQDEGVNPQARPKRLHVRRVIHEPEAQVVRQIFELAAAGCGLRAIAHRLNDAGAGAPSGGGRGRDAAPVVFSSGCSSQKRW